MISHKFQLLNQLNHLGLQIIFVIKPFLARSKRSFTMPSFKALAILFSDLQSSCYVKQHNVSLPLLAISIISEDRRKHKVGFGAY